ncbi:MAG TPA: hypothetical protein VK945_04730, partial [Planococcus sp. (in: firmicutes)]|nr:hypothetical protein [Planococcus sp. (in: firmicutes)]
MNFSINERMIIKYCGMAASKKGKSFSMAGKVALEQNSEDESSMEATVQGKSDFQVSMKQEADESIHASCSCPPVGFITTYCHHIAAVMWAMAD